MQPKFIFVTGGVCSSLGKGIATASLGLLLEQQGFRVSLLKLDPYLNVDPGTMNPFQHGEVYVTDDGAETDLDLGHYYRYTNSPLSQLSNATSGQIYHSVIKRERKGDYLGQTVQVIPHITDEIKRRMIDCGNQQKDTDVVLVEVGGTVGDIESLSILEAIRQFRQERPGQCVNVHLTYVPFIKAAGETKTKPTQHSVQMLREIGIVPDVILCRCEKSLPRELKDKISLFCSVPGDAVIEAVDVSHTVYELPLMLKDQGMDQLICRLLQLPEREADMTEWRALIQKVLNPKGTVTVAIIGKYVKHQDAYKSINEALEHGAIAHNHKIRVKRIEAEHLMDGEPIEKLLDGCDGVLIPGGFGERGFAGKVHAAKYCRENNLPYFGICLGMQALTVEYARNIAHIKHANSTEVEPGTSNPVISLLSEQEGVQDMGGTLRLGAYTCLLKPGTRSAEAYGSETISERHRHRYEFNNKYLKPLEEAGLTFAGFWKERKLVEIAEVPNHPWMVGVQYHPEFKSKPTAPHPLFAGFVGAMVDFHNQELSWDESSVSTTV